MTMITPSYLGETIEYSSLHACRSTLEDPTTPFRAILEPGDFIYIPIYWWHQFRTLEASLNVNFWWQARIDQALRRHGLHYWPRMARDRYLHWTIWRTVVDSISSSHGERKPDSRT